MHCMNELLLCACISMYSVFMNKYTHYQHTFMCTVCVCVLYMEGLLNIAVRVGIISIPSVFNSLLV